MASEMQNAELAHLVHHLTDQLERAYGKLEWTEDKLDRIVQNTERIAQNTSTAAAD